jgi:hypothetical protein
MTCRANNDLQSVRRVVTALNESPGGGWGFYGSTVEALGQKACTFRPNPYARRTFQGVWRLDPIFSVATVIILRVQPW